MGADCRFCSDKPEVLRGHMLFLATFTHFPLNVGPAENYWVNNEGTLSPLDQDSQCCPVIFFVCGKVKSAIIKHICMNTCH